MTPEEVLHERGGIGARSLLVARCGRGPLDRAVAGGSVVAVGRGRYALSSVDQAVAAAHGLAGVLCLTSAALLHGWEVKDAPDRPHVLVPRNRKVGQERRAGVHLHRGTLHADDRAGTDVGPATSVELTLVQCCRALPDDAALAVVDSALRSGVLPATLSRAAAGVRGPGAPRVRELLAAGDGDAANPFESCLRSIALTVPGLSLLPQRWVRSSWQSVRPDLVDVDLRIVVEADSFTWHGSRSALARDARRYNLLVVDGWLVLRFSYEDVMGEPDHVRDVLVAATDLARRRTDLPSGVLLAA